MINHKFDNGDAPMLKELLAQSAVFSAFVKGLKLEEKFPYLVADSATNTLTLSFVVESYMDQGHQFIRLLVNQITQDGDRLTSKVKFVQRIDGNVTDTVLLYGKGMKEKDSLWFFENSANDWLISKSHVDESRFPLRQLIAVCDVANLFTFSTIPTKEQTMKIMIVGGTASMSQAAQAALVQAGIEVQVTEIDSLDVAVCVRGGVVQEIIANVPMNAQIMDFDDGEDQREGDEPNPAALAWNAAQIKLRVPI
jgi:hypothetical protein